MKEKENRKTQWDDGSRNEVCFPDSRNSNASTAFEGNRFSSTEGAFNNEVRIAVCAGEENDNAIGTFLQNGSNSLFIEAPLANMVKRLRRDWIASIAPYWGDIVAINKLLIPDLDKRVAVLLRQGFAQFSDFLCFFEYYFVDLHYRNLSRENFLIKLHEARRYFIGHGRHSGFDEFDKLYSPLDCPYCGGDLSDVHKESLS